MFERIVYGLTGDVPSLASLTPKQAGRQLRDLGCDAVFLMTLSTEWIDGLHQAGLRVYASQPVFLASEELWQQYPESRPVTAGGRPAPVEDWYCPALPTSPRFRSFRLEQLRQMVATFPLDGVWLDFIRWPAHWETPHPHLYDSSFDAFTLSRFEDDSEIDIPPDVMSPIRASEWLLDDAPEPWFEWRCRQISSFAADARQVIDQARPGITLGAFTVPWTSLMDDWPGTTGCQIRIAGQDPSQLSQHVDIISPMAYHRLCGRDTGWIGGVTRWVQEEASCPVWPVVETNEAPGYSGDEFAAACRAAAEAGAPAIIAYKLEGLLADPEKMSVWKWGLPES